MGERGLAKVKVVSRGLDRRAVDLHWMLDSSGWQVVDSDKCLTRGTEVDDESAKQRTTMLP
jgi:hypothetical protein